MKESDLGSRIAAELRLNGCTVFKLHNDSMQRGLPDYLMWSREQAVMAFELKIAASLGSCMLALTPGQASVMRSMAMSPNGATIAFGTQNAAGVFTIKCTSWAKALQQITDNRFDTYFIEVDSGAAAARCIAAMLSGHMQRLEVFS